MAVDTHSVINKNFVKNALESAIKIAALALIVVWCYIIIAPFIMPVLWAVIIAVAVYPAYRKLSVKMGNRDKTTAVLLSVLAITFVIVPTVMMSGSLINAAKVISEGLQNGSLVVPAPNASVKTWPIVGESLYDLWNLAATNIGAAINKVGPQLKGLGSWLLSTAAGVGGGVVQFIISILIAGVFLVTANKGAQAASAIATRLAGEDGPSLANLSRDTIRSVAQGVIGVALIQSVLAGIGLMAMGVPGAGLWALLVLILAIVQLPPILILGPIIFYVFAEADTLPAVLFTIWSLIVSSSDAFLKPLFLGRGMEIPMLVILLGAIGGMISSGIVGLFVGSVVLALGYTLFIAWLGTDTEDEQTESE